MSRRIRQVIASLLEQHPSARVVLSASVTPDSYVMNTAGDVPTLYVHLTHHPVVENRLPGD
jgi:hypothetical protein